MTPTPRQSFIAAIRAKIGRPYIYGGSGDPGYDCSGLVVAGMQEAGLLFRDHTAGQMAAIFSPYKIDAQQMRPGCLLFYGDAPDNINHVMACVDIWPNGAWVLVGANGGSSEVTDCDLAMMHGAYVKVRVGRYWWAKFQYAVDPFHGKD